MKTVFNRACDILTFILIGSSYAHMRTGNLPLATYLAILALVVLMLKGRVET